MCFALLLVCLNFMPKVQTFLGNRIFEWGGSISYGIYMLHLVVLTGMIEVTKFFSSFMPFVMEEILFYTITIGFTLVVAHISNKTIEAYFLRFRTWLQPRD
jgi:peptidoglycan/LPS O-acetylase OafA/YrhL